MAEGKRDYLYPHLIEGRPNTLEDLLEVMAALRDRDTGCPWDIEQDFATIAPYTIEEAYEVADAIERGDLIDLRDELGDLLLQVVYHAQMADEQNAFDFGDVADAIVKKMVRRHPHVFGNAQERAAGVVKGNWDRIKAEEKAVKLAAHERVAGTPADNTANDSPTLRDVPVGLPALTRAVKLQNKAAKVGFDWPTLIPVFEKMKEELGELEHAVADADADAIEEEFGDLLFVVANVARHLSLKPEVALGKANEKFIRRFAYIERTLAARGKTPDQSTLEEMDALWDEAKLEQKP